MQKEVQIYEEYIEQLQSILSLTADELNDAFYERVPKQIYVYTSNLLEFFLSFIPISIYWQYKTSGKADLYKVELTAEQFAKMLKNAPKNDLQEQTDTDTADIENDTNDADDFITGHIRTNKASISFNGAWAQNIEKTDMFIDFMGDKGGARAELPAI